jgi:integrase
MRWVDVNPFDGIPAARPDPVKSRLILNASELLALLDHASNPVERIACALGMNTGLRANDVRHLTVFDASLAGGTIQTEIRKTNKLDVKPITMELARELKSWLDTYADYMGLEHRGELPNDWLLIPSYRLPATWEKNRNLTLRPLGMHTHPWRLVQRPLGRMGYPTKGEGFHTLRRSSARALFESLRSGGEGRDHALMIVKEFLNHAHTSQTEHYLGLNQERVIRDTLLKHQPFLSILAQEEQDRVAPNLIEPLREDLRHGS